MGTSGAITNLDLYRATPGLPLPLAPQPPPTPLYRMSALGAVLYSVWNGEGGWGGRVALSPFRGFSAFGLLLFL